MPEIVQATCPHCKNPVRIPMAWMQQSMRCKHCRQIFQAKQKSPDPAAGQAIVSPRTPLPPQILRSIPVSPGLVPFPGHASAPRRPVGSGWWKGAILAASVLVTAGVLVVVFWDQISELAGDPAERANRNTLAKLIDPKKQFEDQRPKTVAATTTAPETIGTGVVPRPRPLTVTTGVRPQPRKDLPKKVEPAPPKNEPPPETVKVEPPKKEPPKKVEIVKNDPPKKPAPPESILFPRRALAVSVSNYLLANPLNYGVPRDKDFPGSSVRVALTEFGNFNLKFPNTQLFEVSDAAPRDAHPPVKSVLETTIVDFLNSARAQDRVVLLFAGHAVEIDQEAYLVPLDAAIKDADPKDLIALSWLYDVLKTCKARQKVLIVDVCRFDPARGEQRPGSGPMGEVLDAALAQPPDGVQVWSSCVKGQQAYEFERGSVFLQALCAAMQESLPTMADPNDALPLDALVPRVNRHMEKTLAMHKLTQTSRLAGVELKNGAPYDSGVPLAPLVVIKPPSMPVGGMAGPEVVRSIVEELRLVPPVRSANDTKDDITPEALPPFPAKALAPYLADYSSLDAIERNPAKYPLRIAVLKAAQVLRENIDKVRMKEVFPGNNNAQVKQQVLREQVDPGKNILVLKEALEDLKKAGEERKKEKSKRWQANYDYVLARLESRLVYVYEYSYVLAQIRSDALPPLVNGATGYRLGAKKKVGIPEPEVRDWVKEIDRTWQRLAREHANTPWAIVANRERMTVLGLEWRPTRQ